MTSLSDQKLAQNKGTKSRKRRRIARNSGVADQRSVIKYIPTRSQIDKECEAIRAEWPDHRFIKDGDKPDPVRFDKEYSLPFNTSGFWDDYS